MTWEIDENDVKIDEKQVDMASGWQRSDVYEGFEVEVVVGSAQEEKSTNLAPINNHPSWPREMYDWPDKTAKKLKLSKLQYDFIQNYLSTGNATKALRDAKWEITEYDTQKASRMKDNTRINMYIQETAMECAEIQFNEIIKNPKAPMAVRNDAIKDRLTRAWVGAKDEEDRSNMYVGNVNIVIDK